LLRNLKYVLRQTSNLGLDPNNIDNTKHKIVFQVVVKCSQAPAYIVGGITGNR